MEETGEDFNSPVLFAIVENFFYDPIVDKHFHEFLYIYKGQIQTKASYVDDSSAAQVILWMPKSEIKLLKPDVLSDLALRSSDQVVHLVNLESR
ncbi:hypothetical protein AVENLUH5627_01003 [Acinetobacter venetianus]|uniref:Nudix hydrolase domain-containing protein n=1 Tax=Acinetobacter venetianus TaxID=52133 RepID=A0A150HZ56_9GAMM|nr:hypothetical protein AVENLUH5627_01003 [Acinetobacter venetianus]